MATKFEQVYDLFLIKVQDYKIYKFDTINETLTFLEGILIASIPLFYKSRTSLDYTIDEIDPSLSTFTEDLTQEIQMILSELMTISWLQREIRNVTQFKLHLQNNDFKSHSEASNLKAKQAYLIVVRENSERLMNRYSWNNQNVGDML